MSDKALIGYMSGSGSTILTGRSFIVAAQLFFSFAFSNLDGNVIEMAANWRKLGT